MTLTQAPPDLGRSWWLREALAREEFAEPPAPALTENTRADVVILGGGYTGMWAAWFLKQREPALDVVLLESDICGGGPSGRNGGLCDGWLGDVAKRISSPMFRGGMFIPDSANLHPARLARGLRRVLIEAGLRIHEGTPVIRFGCSSPAIAETPRGTVRAEKALIALGAWAT